MFVNGAGTGGAEQYQAICLLLVRLPVLAAYYAVAVGIATATTAGLLIGTTTTRTTVAPFSASALFAPRSSPIWAGRRLKPCKRSSGSAERPGCSILPERICGMNF